ncbi:MAG: 30S ribosomal protein S6 [Solirubrobacterales bacterium]
MSNRTYDLVVLLDADAPTDTRTKIVTDAQSLINQHGAIKATKDWGTRQLPYLIDHHEQAAYHVFQFETLPASIEQLDRGLKLTEGVLRFRIFETEGGELPDNPPLFKREERTYERPPREASATPTRDIEETPAAEAPAADAAPAEADVPAADAPVVDAPAEPAPEASDEATAPSAEDAPAE